MNADLDMLCNWLLGALFNGGYQGLVLTTLIWLGLKIIPRANAATRHMVWLIMSLFVALLPVVHLLLTGPGGKEASPQGYSVGKDWHLAGGNIIGPRTNFSTASIEARVADMPESLDSVNPRKTFGVNHGLSRLTGRDSTFRDETSVSQSIYSERFGKTFPRYRHQRSKKEGADESIREAGLENTLFAEPPVPVDRDSGKSFSLARFLPVVPWNWQLSLPDRTAVVLVGVWIVLASLRLGSLARQFCRVHFLKRRATPAPESLRTLFETLSKEMGIRRKTHLMMCHESSAPMAVGFRRPAVLLPAKIFEGGKELQLEQVLRHELAHVGRADDWANLTQQMIKAVLFFHPAIWWLSRRLTVEREIACDDHVLAATQTPRAYALFLTEFASRMQGRDLAAAPAAWSNKNQLEERITMILNPNRNSSPRLARARAGLLTAAAALAAILVLHAGPRLALAAEARTEADPAEVAIANQTPDAIDVSAVAESTVESIIESESAALQALIAAPDDAPASPAAAIESGPRPKPQPTPEAPLAAPIPQLAPPPPRAPHVVHATVLPTPPFTFPAVPSLAAAPAGDGPAQPAPAAPPRSRKSGDSIERRLERLEQLVDSLIAREKAPKKRTDAERDFNFSFKGPTIEFDKEKFAKLAEESAKLAEQFSKGGLNAEELARIKEQAGREAERAARDLDRVAKDLERAKSDAQYRTKIEERRVQGATSGSAMRETFAKQRQALQAHRKSLEKQMEAIEQQIQRLEEEHQKAEEQGADLEKRIKKRDPNIDSTEPENSDSKEKPKISK